MVVVIVFSLANRGAVTVDLWPFDLKEQIPLSWLLLGALFAGFLIGGVVMWLSGAKARHRARDLRFDKAHLEREVIRLRREVERSTERTSRSAASSADRGTGGKSSLPMVSSGR